MKDNENINKLLNVTSEDFRVFLENISKIRVSVREKKSPDTDKASIEELLDILEGIRIVRAIESKMPTIDASWEEVKEAFKTPDDFMNFIISSTLESLSNRSKR